MNKASYLYRRELSTRYRFLSIGRKPIEKIVEFTPLALKNIYNLGFGDLLPNGEIDDKTNSNNSDIIKVLSTVINIIKDFTEENPELKIAFIGSTKERTALYQRILKPISILSVKNFSSQHWKDLKTAPGKQHSIQDIKTFIWRFL